MFYTTVGGLLKFLPDLIEQVNSDIINSVNLKINSR